MMKEYIRRIFSDFLLAVMGFFIIALPFALAALLVHLVCIVGANL